MRICREHPLVADVPPDFTVLDELEGVLWSNQWFYEALDTLPQKLYEQVPYFLMCEALRTLLKDPITAKQALSQGTERWQQLAQTLQQNALNELLQNPVWLEARDTLQTYQGKAGESPRIRSTSTCYRGNR